MKRGLYPTTLYQKTYHIRFFFFFRTLQQQLLDKDPIFQNFFNLFLLPMLLKKVWQLKRISLQTKTLVLFFQKNKIRNNLCSAVFRIRIHMIKPKYLIYFFVFSNIKGPIVLASFCDIVIICLYIVEFDACSMIFQSELNSSLSS